MGGTSGRAAPSGNPSEPSHLRVADVARRVGLPRYSVYRAIARGDLRAARVGRTLLVEAASLRALLDAGRRPES